MEHSEAEVGGSGVTVSPPVSTVTNKKKKSNKMEMVTRNSYRYWIPVIQKSLEIGCFKTFEEKDVDFYGVTDAINQTIKHCMPMLQRQPDFYRPVFVLSRDIWVNFATTDKFFIQDFKANINQPQVEKGLAGLYRNHQLYVDAMYWKLLEGHTILMFNFPKRVNSGSNKKQIIT